jgi:hypothetical protein
MVYLFNKAEEKRSARSSAILKNNFYMKGTVLTVKKSRNHDFGIILLHVRSSSSKLFNDTLNKSIYPYKVIGSKAELYTIIPDGVKDGDEVVVDSNKETAYYNHVKTKEHDEEYISIVNDPYNLDYVKENTAFK